MSIKQLMRLGLSESLAATYITLLQHGKLRPPELARLNHETRTNAYALLDRLVELGLAKKVQDGKKTLYEAEHPMALEQLVKRQRDEALERERLTQDAMPELTNLYQFGSERPGVRFYQGKEGIEEIYKEQVRTAEPITYIRSQADFDLLGFPFAHAIRTLAPRAGIKRHAFTPDCAEVLVNWREADKQWLLTRTWYQSEDYTAPVEWSVFGNKVAAISFGKEAIGLIIDSPQIAESLRQMFSMMDKGLHSRKDYDKLPRLAALKDVSDMLQPQASST